MSVLSAADCQIIESAIQEAETHTAGEIVVAAVPESATYAGPRAIATALWTVGWAILVYSLVPRADPLWILVGQLPMSLALFWLTGVGAVLRFVVPKSHIAKAVHGRAMQLFIERGVHQTRDRSGLLLLISEHEHHVEILADQGIHERVGERGWEEFVGLVTTGLRQGTAAAGVVAAVEKIGAVLATEFPPRSDDYNELSNQVVRPIDC